jgi:hypothetical protein
MFKQEHAASFRIERANELEAAGPAKQRAFSGGQLPIGDTSCKSWNVLCHRDHARQYKLQTRQRRRQAVPRRQPEGKDHISFERTKCSSLTSPITFVDAPLGFWLGKPRARASRAAPNRRGYSAMARRREADASDLRARVGHVGRGRTVTPEQTVEVVGIMFSPPAEVAPAAWPPVGSVRRVRTRAAPNAGQQGRERPDHEAVHDVARTSRDLLVGPGRWDMTGRCNANARHVVMFRVAFAYGTEPPSAGTRAGRASSGNCARVVGFILHGRQQQQSGTMPSAE